MSIEQRIKDRNIPIRVALGGAAAVGLYVISRDNYLLFHVLAELFSIVVAWTVFVIFWNTRKIEESTYFLLIGIAVLFVGFLDPCPPARLRRNGRDPRLREQRHPALDCRPFDAGGHHGCCTLFHREKNPGPARIYRLPCRYRAAARIDIRMGSLPGLLR